MLSAESVKAAPHQSCALSDFAKDMGVSVPTIKSWLSALEPSRIVYLLPPYYNNLGKRIIKSPKVYFTDIGIVCHLTGVRDKTHLLQGPLAGPLFENFCVQETIKTFFNQGLPPRIYYLRAGGSIEVDLILEGAAGSLIPMEIKLTKTPSTGMGSGISRLRKVFSGLHIKSGVIVSLTEETVPVSSELTAITFDDYLSRVAEVARQLEVRRQDR